MNNNKKFNIAVAGATGAVGLEMLRMLESRKFPISNITFFASEKSAGKTLKFNNKSIKVTALKKELIGNYDIALFSAGATISKEFAPIFANKGAFVIDNSSAWRMDPKIPLVVPEVNSHELKKDKKIIANPNCSTIQMVVVLNPLHKISPIKSIRVSTYQAVSGAGAKGIYDLETQTQAWAKGKKSPPPIKIHHKIAFNVVPQIDVFLDNGFTKEEIKMVNETQKIMGSSKIKVSATCVRVPVFRSHSEAVWIETQKPISLSKVTNCLKKAQGVTIIDNPSKSEYPMPIDAEGQSTTYVGRIRKDIINKNGLVMWIVSDNLLKGAALNAVEIAEVLVKKGLV